MKPIDLEDLYSEEFVLRWIAARELSWGENDPVFSFKVRPRFYSGFLHLKHCDAEFITRDGERLLLHKNDIAFLPSGLQYSLRVFNCDPSQAPSRLLDFQLLNRRDEDSLFRQKIRKLPAEVLEPFSLYFDDICSLQKQPYYLHARTMAMVCYLIAEILTVLRHGVYDGAPLLTIAKGVTYMEQNYTSKITNKQLAELCCVSPDCFIRTFKKHYGVTPKRYLLNLRLNKAKEQLDTHMMTVQEVAAHLGFENTPYFSRLFKKKMGVTPSRYRKHDV